ncbi:MAG: lytic transglycosylase domain-containing protein [Desulfatitalea sp.]|nr:lytic transglycosylase domain-containing protein [Desulfatitalea sp.]
MIFVKSMSLMNDDHPHKKTYYKMFWIRSFSCGDIQRTVKHGVILYLVMAILALPSGLCSQQHRVPAGDKVLPAGLSDRIEWVEIQDLVTELAMAGFRRLPQQTDGLTVGESFEADSDEAKPPFHDHIMQAARTYQVDPYLIRAIIIAESSYNPLAVSRCGARGLMQLMPRTAKSLGVADSFDPAMNIDGGVRYFKLLLDRFQGDVHLALAAYNAGSRYVRQYGGVPPFRATRNYIKKVLHYQKKFQKDMAENAPGRPAA